MTHLHIDNPDELLKAKNQFDGQLVHGAKKFHSATNRTGKDKPASGEFTRDFARSIIDTGVDRYQRKEGFWERVKECPVCASKKREFLFSRYALDIYRCTDCTHGYLNPRIVYDKAMEFYTDDRYSFNIYSSALQIQLDEIMFNFALTMIQQFDPPGQEKIMDLGCGAGTMLKAAHANGWRQCVGVDVNKKYVDIYQDTEGVQFVYSAIENLDVGKLGTEYDCVTMWEMLEHVYDLRKVLATIKQLLKKNGILFVKLPNFLSLATRLSREMSPTFSWKHVSYFTQDSLKLLMRENEFEFVHMDTIISEIDNIKSYMSGEHPYHGHGDPDHLFDFITPEYLYKNDLGSRIIGIFRNT